MSDRRYTEDEAAEIFRRAAEMEQTAPRALAANEGMTLAELQSIGSEAGLAPEFIARAAKAPVPLPAHFVRSAGLPVGVRHTVELDHAMSDREWELLVGELRTAFDARGSVVVQGSLRQWSNGNLHALVEPTERGSRVRFRTTNGSARGMIAFGSMLLVTAGIVGLSAALRGLPDGPAPLAMAGAMLAAGTGMLGAAAVRLRAWSRIRGEQMRQLGARLLQ